MSDLLNISVLIADRPYRLKVNREEETKVREAAKHLNDKITEFQNSYHANDKQDYLAMAALLFTTDLLKIQEQEASQKDREGEILDQVEHSLVQLEACLS